MEGEDKYLTQNDHEDLILQRLELYESACRDQSVKAEWGEMCNDKYASPLDFFSEDNLREMSTWDPGKRMYFFSRISKDIHVSPSDGDLYFQAFPDDFEAFHKYILFEENPSDSREYCLWSILAPRIFKHTARNEYSYGRNQWLDIAERRELAPDHLLSYDKGDISRQVHNFGDAASAYLETYKNASANPIEIMERITGDKMFATDEYKSLDNDGKSELLKLILADLHHTLIFHEVNNSSFTKEREAKFNQESRAGTSVYQWQGHSILFDTFQPSGAYNLAQAKFDYQMDTAIEIGGEGSVDVGFNRMTLEVLKQFKTLEPDNENVDTIVEFWDKNKNPIFANAVVEALTVQGPSRAASKLMERIRGNSTNKHALAAILYRIEFGQIGISKDGVKYLESVYDLGELNNPDLYAQRLTSEGDIGVFDSNHALIRYFNADCASLEEEKVKVKVRDFVYETLFVAPKSETEEQKTERLKCLDDFQKNYFSYFASDFFKNTGLQFNNFSFQEQGSFVAFTRNNSDEIKKRAFDFVKSRGELGFEALLSLQPGLDDKTRDLLFSLNTNVPSETMSAILVKFNELNQLANSVFDMIDENKKQNGLLSHTMSGQVYLNSIHAPDLYFSIKNQACKLLKKADAKVDSLRTQGKKITEKDLESTLFEFDREGIKLRATLGVAVEDPKELNIEQIPSLALERSEGYEISQRDKRDMKIIYEENYADKPKFAGRLAKSIDDFTGPTYEGHREFWILRDGEKVAGFLAFEYDGNSKSVKFSKFNVHPGYKSISLGTKMMDETLEDVANHWIVKAETDVQSQIAEEYINNRGFIATKCVLIDEIKALELVRNDSKNLFISKMPEYGKDNIRKMLGSKDGWVELDYSIKAYSCKVSELPENIFDILNTHQKDASGRYVSYAITRYYRFPNKSGDEKVVIIFEGLESKDMDDFGNKFREGGQKIDWEGGGAIII
jgi:N-acetylglutamate synthase-like GNAT family acetyltransferase